LKISGCSPISGSSEIRNESAFCEALHLERLL
jgi:hypothetical protein